MPLILGTNSIKDTGYDVANSLRFNSGSSDDLVRTSDSQSTTKFTWSAWIKRSKLSSFEVMWNERQDSNNFTQTFWESGSPVDSLSFQSYKSGSYHYDFKTNRLFRDPSAWYHIIFILDTTLGTQSDRIKIYVNGLRETSFHTSTNNINQNDTLSVNGGASNDLKLGSNGSSGYFNGYMCEVVYVSNDALAHTDFGEFDEDSGIWKPKDVSGLTFGTAGYYLDFEDSSALGNDVSGNNNDFTVNNLTATDQSTDTCTNNFATLNPLDNYYAASTFSEGNLKIVTNGSAIIYNTSTIGFSSGKWYMETKVSGNVRYVVGVIRGVATANNNDNKIGNRSDGWGYDYRGLVENNGSDLGGSFASYTSGDIIGIYADLDNNELYFSKNGTLQNSGTGLALTAGTYFFALGNNHTSESSTLEANFGSPPFSISSGNTDANGYGNFEYDPSAGTFDSASKDFLSLNTKNLAEYG